jgi:hypothetical protein
VAVSGAGAYAENVVTSSALAHIDGSDVSAPGDVIVAATNESSISAAVIAASLAVSVSGSTGVGVSIGIAIARNFIGQDRAGGADPVLVHAYTEDSRIISTGGAVSVTADASQSINALTFAGSAAVAGGSTGVAVSGSGVWNENVVDVSVLAAIDGDLAGETGTMVEGDSITVAASNNSSISAFAGAASVAVAFGSTGVAVSIGLGLAHNRIGGAVEARIMDVSGGVEARTGDIDVTAEDAADITVTAAAASVAAGFGSTGIAVSGAGAEATNRINTATKAHITTSKADATAGDVTVEADATGAIRAVVVAASAAVAVGQTGVGASIGVAVARNLIGYSQTAVAAANDTSDSVSSLQHGVTTVEILEGARKGDVYRYIGETVVQADNVVKEDGTTAPYALNSQDYSNTDLWELINLGEDRASIEAAVIGSDIGADGALTVDARSEQSIKATTIAGSVAVAGGQVGVAVSGSGAGVENRIATDVKAHISGAGTDVEADHVVVNADDMSTIDTFAAAFSISAAFGQTGVAVAIGISIAINEIANDVSASIEDGNVTTSGSDGITVSASSPELPLGGSVTDTVLLGAPSAGQLDDASSTDMIDDETPDATDVAGDAAILAQLKTSLAGQGLDLAGALRISMVEEGVSWTVVDEDGTSVSIRKDGANLTAERASINAVSLAAALAVAAGQVGVGIAGAGAVALNSIQSNVSAYVDGATLDANGDGDVVIDARSDSEISAVVLSTAVAVAAGQVGVGVGIGVSVARNFIGLDLTGNAVAGSGKVSAYATESAIDAGGSLTINAEAAQSIRAVTFAGAVAVAGGQVGVGVAASGAYAENEINATVEAYIDGDGSLGTTGSTGVRADSITVKAADTSEIDAFAGAAAISAGFGMVGVAVSAGISIAFNAIGSEATAAIRNANDEVEARAGDIDVLAANDATIRATSAAAAVAVSAGLVGVSFAGAGAHASNEIETTTTAAIEDSIIDVNGGGDLTVQALGNARIEALIISAAVAFAGGAVGVGVSVGVSLAENRIGGGDGTGVFAYIDGSTVNAEGDVLVEAKMDEALIDAKVVAMSVAIAGGATVAAAAAGSGADALNELDYAVIAYIADSDVTAIGNSVTVNASDNSEIDSFVGAASVAGSAGYVGGSVSIAVALSENSVDNTIAAYVDNSDVEAGSLNVTADDDSVTSGLAEAAALSVSISLGFAASGSGARSDASYTSSIAAYVTGSGGNDHIDLSGDLTVNATARPSVFAQTGVASVAVGLASLAASGGVVNVTAAPDVDAYVTSVQVDAADVLITAKAQVHAKGEAFGVSASTGLSMGGNVVQVLSTPSVHAYAGGSTSRFDVANLTVEALTERNAGRLNADAYAASSAGGLLLGATSTYTQAQTMEEVRARITDGADVNATGKVTVKADSQVAQKADANSAALGLIGAGASIADAISTTMVRANVANATIDASELSIQARGVADNTAVTTAGSGGLVSGSAAAPTTTTIGDVAALIRDGAQITLGTGAGLLTVSASHLARPNTLVVTNSFGLIAGAGAVADNTVDADVTVRIGTQDNDATGADVTAKSMDIRATNTVDKVNVSGNNIEGDAGGLVSGAAAHSNITISLATVIDIDDHSTLTTTDENGALFARAFNDIRVTDKVALFTAGALSGAGAYVDLTTPQLLAQITVGEDATVHGAGEVEFEAQGENDIFLQSLSETYGAGTVAIGHAKIDVRPDNEIHIFGTVLAEGNLYLSAGTDKDGRLPDNTLVARVDNFAGSVIPIDDLETRAIYLVDNLIHVHALALAESYQNIHLTADELGFATVDGVAKATNWVSAVGDAVDGLLGGNNTEIGEGQGLADAHADVINDGTVRTGATRLREIVIEYDDATDTFYEASGTGDITFSVDEAQVQSSNYRQLQQARENLARYSVTKSDGTSSTLIW